MTDQIDRGARQTRAHAVVPLAGARVHQPGDVRQLLRLRLHQPAGRRAEGAARVLRLEHRPAAGDLQLPEHRHGAHRRHDHRPHRHEAIDAAVRRSHLPRSGAASCTALDAEPRSIDGGRAGLIFGLGAESLIVAVTTAIARWFRGKELSFAFGINLTIARLGSFAALNSPSWASRLVRQLAVAAADLGRRSATICVVGAVLYWILETRRSGATSSARRARPTR